MTPDSDMIHEYLAHLREIGRADKTIHTYGTVLWAANRELPTGVATAKKDEIAAWLQRPELRTPAARRTYLAALRSYCRWAHEVGHISRDEAQLVRRPPQPYSLPNPCTDQELATILARAPEPYRTWSVIAAYAGARCVEISRLDREHVTADRVQLHGKGDRPRRVPTHPLVWEALRDRPRGPVAGGHTAGYVSGRLRQVYLALGLDVTAHQLRHWYGTTLVANGAGLEEVRELMGHANLTTTLGYVRVASPRLRAAVHRLPAVESRG